MKENIIRRFYAIITKVINLKDDNLFFEEHSLAYLIIDNLITHLDNFLDLVKESEGE